MNEVLKINYEAEQPTVSARELHEALGISKRFSAWFEVNSKGFIAGQDFTSVLSGTVVNNGATREIQDYNISTEKLSSETGFKGLLKKIVMFIVIAVSFSIQELIGNTIPLREVVIMFYICNEALSLLENAAVFVPIPDKLKDVLIQLRDKDTEEDTEGE